MMFGLTCTSPFLLILRTRLYHSPKSYHPQPPNSINEPSADSTY